MSNKPVTIFNIQKFSTEDGPGIRTTVFFKGCPMRCPWCHNPESQRREPELVWHRGRCLGDGGCIDTCPEKALALGESGIRIDRAKCAGCGECVAFCPASALEMHGRRVKVEDLFAEAARDRAFYETSGGGVTLSGGEPLAQPAGAIALLRMLKEAGIHTALDTCGAVKKEALEQALAYCDLVLLDIKCTDPDLHVEWTGVPFERVAATARAIDRAAVPLWVRLPVIPSFTARDDVVEGVARFLAENLSHCERLELLAFSNLCTGKFEQLDREFPLAGQALLAKDEMLHFAAVAEAAGTTPVRWSGPTRMEHAAETEEAVEQ